ncbi:hypothetical protein [Conexibacter sp. DBS9H8]|uniref:hypothetical protein n=1 Tax=Conexibacter sp. DBS9H8 TaxID=2937801 RepID=UPI00200FDB44|nr:hypothetical protein [Conexibacter sp. DBS9H8]
MLRLPAPDRRGLSVRLSRALALALAAVPVLVCVGLASRRLGYPYELDWLESGTVELVQRVLDGRGLYAPPSLRYVGFTYTPLYSYLGAAVAAIIGNGFLALRLISFTASLGAIAVVGVYVRDVTGDRVAGALAAGLFAATDSLTGWFFDVARLDALFVALALVTLWRGRRMETAWAGAGVGVLGFLAFFTKQIGLVTVVPALLLLLPWRPRAALSALLVLGLLVGVSTLAFNAATDGWYRYYVVAELAGQPTIPQLRWQFWSVDLFSHLHWLTGLLGLGGLAALPALGRRRPDRERLGRWLYDLGAVGGLLATAWLSRVHSGGYLNVLIPAYAAAAGLGGIAVAALRRRAGVAGTLIAVALIGLQYRSLLADTSAALPSAADERAGRELMAAPVRCSSSITRGMARSPEKGASPRPTGSRRCCAHKPRAAPGCCAAPSPGRSSETTSRRSSSTSRRRPGSPASSPRTSGTSRARSPRRRLSRPSTSAAPRPISIYAGRFPSAAGDLAYTRGPKERDGSIRAASRRRDDSGGRARRVRGAHVRRGGRSRPRRRRAAARLCGGRTRRRPGLPVAEPGAQCADPRADGARPHDPGTEGLPHRPAAADRRP